MDVFIEFLSNDDGTFNDGDIDSFSHNLQSISLKDIITKSHILGEKIDVNYNDIIKEYELFCLESKMKFLYSINIDHSRRTTISFLKDMEKIISDLNYCAYLVNSKSEIDSIITSSKNILRYEFYLGSNNAYKKCELSSTIEDNIITIISPYFVDNYINENLLPNNPFHSLEEYIICLLSPYKYKFTILESVKNVLNLNNNILLANFIEGGIELLRKNVVTYRSQEIINLFIITHYIIHLIIENVLQFSQELHDVASFIHSEIVNNGINESESYVPKTVHDHFRIVCTENDSYSFESEMLDNPLSKSDNTRLNAIDETYKRKWAQLQKIYIKIFKIGISKIVSRANASFFKKYYGRIPHLYSQYGDRAVVVENTMVGDPGEILSVSAVKYVEKMSNDSTDIFNSLLQITRRLGSVTNIEERINVVNTYCKQFKLDKNNPDSIKEGIINETRYKIASSILQDNEIYGFTVDGIMQNKKFPPANHIVTSLFVKNPHEKPGEQSVSLIFSGAEHILQFAHPENLLKFNNLFKQSASKIIDTFNPKVASMAEKNIEKAARKFSYQIMHKDNDAPSMLDLDPKEQKQISDDINKGLIKALDMAIDQKRRCLQCAGIAHDMIARVTDLAKRCVVAMLNVEKELTDKSRLRNKPVYNSGNKLQKNRSITKQLEANKKHIEERNQEYRN
jgi:hypothetical protein